MDSKFRTFEKVFGVCKHQNILKIYSDGNVCAFHKNLHWFA